MAQLTDTLQSPQSGPQTVVAPVPGNAAGDVFSGLSGLVSGFFGAERQGQQMAASRATQARENVKFQEDQIKFGQDQKKYADDQTDKNASEATSNIFFNTFTDAAGPQAANAASQIGDQMTAAQSARDQGRMSPAAYNLKAQSLLAPILAQFPNSHAAVYDQLKKMGVDNLFTRQYDQVVKDDDNVRDAVRKGQASAIEWATTKGGIDPSTVSPAQLESLGRQGLQAEQNLQTLQTRTNIAQTNSNMTKSDYDFQKNQAADAAFASVNDTVAPALAGVIANFQKLSLDPTVSDEVKVQKLGQLAQTLQASGQALIADRMIKYGAVLGPRRAEAENMLNGYLGQITTAVTGPLSTVQQNARILQNMQTSLGISVDKALPLMSSLTKALGPQVGQFFTSAALSDPNITSKLTAEIKGVGNNGFETPEGHVHMQNMIGIMTGQMGFKQMTPEHARTILPSLANTFVRITDPKVIDSDSGAQKAALHTGAQLANAAVELSAASGPAALTTATQLLTRNSMVYLLAKSSGGENKSLVATTAPAVRAAAQQVHNSWNDVATGDKFYNVNYNKVTGQYEVVRNNVAAPVNNSGARFGPMGDSLAGGAPSTVTPNSVTQQKVAGLNNTLRFLVQTAPAFEDSVNVKGATPQQLKAFYAQGVPLPSMKNKETGKTDPNAWDKNLQSLRQQALGILSNVDFQPAPHGQASPTAPFESVAPTIRHTESGNNYNRVVYDTPAPKPVTSMTIGEAYDFQKGPLRDQTRGKRGQGDIGSTGIGAYQFESETLRQGAEEVFGKDWRSVPMTPENQDKIARVIHGHAQASRTLPTTWAAFKG